jgi:hypothetical protein
MGDRHPPPNAGGAYPLATEQQPEERVGVSRGNPEQRHQVAQHSFAAVAGNVQADGIGSEKVAQSHGRRTYPLAARAVNK